MQNELSSNNDPEIAALKTTIAEHTNESVDNNSSSVRKFSPEPLPEPMVAIRHKMGALLENPIDDSHDILVPADEAQLSSNEHQFNVIIASADPTCVDTYGNSDIAFTNNTAALKSKSISALESIVDIYHQCRKNRITIRTAGQNASSFQKGVLTASSEILAAIISRSLLRRREDRVKYYLLHMRFDMRSIRLPDLS